MATWDKARWITEDLGELRCLVETIQLYNSELAGILDGPRVYGVEGLADRELTASSDNAVTIVSWAGLKEITVLHHCVFKLRQGINLKKKKELMIHIN